MTLSPTQILANLPSGLRTPLLKAYAEITGNFRQGRWEPSELNGGKLCEVVYTILAGHVAGKFPAKPTKPRNMVDACRNLEKANPTLPRSVRIQIPRMMIALYEFRNNRGVGHVGGDVDPNHMDAVAVLGMAKWIVAELVRMFHGVSTEEATRAIDALVERLIPIIWHAKGQRRVLDPSLSKRDQTLLLLYGSAQGASEQELVSWVEHSNPSIYRRDILRKLHRERLIEYDESGKHALLSPTGIKLVEDSLPLEV